MKKFTLLIFASLLSICGYGQLTEGFENPWTGSPAAPPGWTVVNEVGPVQTWVQQTTTSQKPSHTGTFSAFVDKENVCSTCALPKDWLITPYFNMPANAQLRFFSRLTFALDQGGIYKVKISTDADPSNLAAYTDLQTWTELTLNPVQTEYTEKVITLPNITGNVHIAFVMEGDDKDRWLIDDVSVTSQCHDPSNLTISNITLNTAQLNWINNGSATSWEIEVIQDNGQQPTGTGEIHNGPPPFTKTNLIADTPYRAYIRALCSDGGKSAWIGPIYFITDKVGERCSYPIQVASLPYTTTDNTSGYANYYTGTPGAIAGCVAGTAYLTGNDVIYQYTPTVTGNINISLSGAAAGSAVLVYDNCSDIGVTCIGGGINNPTIASLAVTAGNSIFIVISTNATATVTPYTLNIQQVNCAAPATLAATNPTSSTMDISWAVGTATSWELAVQPAGTGLPMGSGIPVATNALTVSQTTTGAPLAPATCYEYYVRSNCNNGTYSIWSGPMNFCTTQIPAPVPYTQNWETPPHNWQINNGTQVNKWVVGSAVNNGGTQSLYISNDNGVNNIYTITSASVVHAYRDIMIPAGATSMNLAFDWKSFGESADYIRAYLVPVSFTPTVGTQITASATNIKIGGDLFGASTWNAFNGVVNVTTVAGTPRRLVLEWRNTASIGVQNPAAIDNINFSVISCPAPSNPTVVAGTLTSNSVNISWTAPTSIPSAGYDYYVSTSPTAPTATTPYSGQSATTTATGVVIQPAVAQYFWVRANCGPGDTSTWAGPVSFIAPQIPATLEYSMNFDSGASNWSLSNGTQFNKWVIGSATSSSASNSLYITQDGTANSYNNSALSVVHAYRDITIPPSVDQLELTFDWKNVGEAADYVRVWIVPTTFNPTPGTLITASATNIAVGAQLSQNGTWTTVSNIIPVTAINNSNRRIIFEWRNDASNSGAQPPAAIDNINLKVVPCPQPSTLVLSSLTPAAATFTWVAPAAGFTEYDYYLSTSATPPTAATAETGGVTALTVSLPSLPPSTTHYMWVRTDCGANKSYWIGPVSFITPQIPATINFTQNFDLGAHGFDFISGTLPNKWTVGSATSNSAPNSMYISNDNGVSNAYNNAITSVVHAYRDITFPAVGDQFLLTFDWKNVGVLNADYFRVWMVPVDFIPTPGTQITAVTGVAARTQVVAGNIGGSSVWVTSNTVLAGANYIGKTMRLVFEWRNGISTGTQPAAIDNISLSLVTCPTPSNILMPSNNAAGVTFTWTPPTVLPQSYDYYYTQSMVPPTPTTTISGNTGNNTPSVTLAGLPPSSTYYFWVRDYCGPGDTSLWVGPFEFSTPIVPVSLNYLENFDSGNYGWVTKNGTQTNKWVVGTAVSNSGAKSLYISNNAGVANAYTNTTLSVVHAYKDFIVPAGTTSLDFTFDWRNQGETNIDYIKVWRVPTNFVPTTGTLITAAADRIQIGALLANNANWSTANFVFAPGVFAGTSMRIIFEWRNDTFGGTNPAGAIDNIDLRIVTCPKPTALGASVPTQVGATLNWTENGTATNWEVYVIPAGQAAPTDASVGVNAPSNPFVYTTPALQPSTNYVYYVRALCGTNDASKWSGPFAFKTAIANDECAGAYTLPVNPFGQDCAQSLTGMYTGATPSPQPYNCGGTNGGDIWYQFVATSERHNITLAGFTTFTTAQNVVIELYQGDQCGSLVHVACATTNVMMAKNLVPGAIYKVRFYINATPIDQATGFTICVNTPGDLSGSGQEACQITTINASFETPVITNGLYPDFSIDDDSVQGWRTTATDEKMEFWPVPNYENHPGYQGNQFIELNATEISGLYQDYDSPEGTTFTYSFGHKARQGTDVCEVLAGPPGGPYVSIQTASTGVAAWATYTGTYTTPAGQPLTRFIFKAVSTGSGSPTTGNFLDGIDFKADNSIKSVSESNLTCMLNTTTVTAAGAGEWGAEPGNPSPTTIDNPSSNTTTISGFDATGDYSFSWTTQNCTSTITVHYDNGNVPAPTVVSTLDYCQGDVAPALEATTIDGNTLNWYTTETGGTADSTAPTPDTSVPGSTVYYVSQYTSLQCESPRVPITVNVHAIPVAPVVTVTAIEYCEDTTAAALEAIALAGHTLNWYTEPTGGTASTTAPTPSTADAGVTSYYVSQISANSCESNRVEIVVTVNASIIPVTDFTFAVNSVCIEDVNPVAVPGAGMTAGGYYSSTPGLIINPATGEIDLATSTAGTYTVSYTVTADPAVCNIGNSSTAEITIVPLADAVTAFSYTTPVCSDTANQLPVLAPAFTTGGTFTAEAGLAIDAATGEVNIAASTPGDYNITYTVDQSVPNCVATGTSSVPFRITQIFVPVTTFDYANSFCYNAADASPNLAPDFTAGGTFTGTSGLVIDAATGIVDVDSSMAGEHTVTYTTVADPANCIYGGTSSYTFTIGSELEFSFNGQCEGSAYVVTASPVSGSYDNNDPSVSFKWTTTAGTVIGTEYHINVSDYANSTPENDTFPMELALTVTEGGCETTRTFVVENITCSIQKGISPNNDGYNDYFDLEFLGVKKLSIFNRYGQEVYTKGNYKNEWIGQGSNGDELPTGTYYFVIERTAGGTDTGWIYINRQE